MNKLIINNIDDLIKFIIELFDDEFNNYIDNMGSFYYFLHGGCFELAQIVSYFFKDAIIVEKKDRSHCAILYNGKIYDAFNAYSEKTLSNLGYDKIEFIKNINDYSIMSNYDLKLAKYRYNVGKTINIENNSVAVKLINELKNIENIKVGDLL